VFSIIENDPEIETIIPGFKDKNNLKHLQDTYARAFCSVVTRCFGWGLPTTVVVPFADFINHHNVDSSYEIVSRDIPPV
jgi:hypothetical protein